MKPREELPDPALHKETLIERLDEALKAAPGTNFSYTQPIQMRFNELLAGVRGDVSIKLFGDDFAAMEKSVEKIRKTLQSIPGAADVKAEEVAGLPLLSIE